VTHHPTPDPDLTDMMRNFMAGVRREALKREERDMVDRVLAAASLAIAALLIAWPRDRQPPILVAAITKLGKEIWKRRSWWLP
jgi:hypothetical protein